MCDGHSSALGGLAPLPGNSCGARSESAAAGLPSENVVDKGPNDQQNRIQIGDRDMVGTET